MIEDKRKDIKWINTMKALCMIAVYIVHCQKYYGLRLGELNHFIQAFYVNGFFFASGYLIFKKQFTPNILFQSKNENLATSGLAMLKNIFFRIMIPSILFSVLDYLPKKLLRGEHISCADFLFDTIGGGTMWFTSALSIAELLLLLMFTFRLKSIWIYAIICGCISLLGLHLVSADFHLLNFQSDLWSYLSGLLSMSFLAVGGLYWYYEAKVHHFFNLYITSIGIIAYLIYFACFSETCKVWVSTHDINIQGYVISFASCVLLAELCKRFRIPQCMSFIGQYSLCFYFVSGAVPIVLSFLFKNLFHSTSIPFVIAILVFSLLLASIITLFVNKHMAWMLDLRLLYREKSS